MPGDYLSVSCHRMMMLFIRSFCRFTEKALPALSGKSETPWEVKATGPGVILGGGGGQLSRVEEQALGGSAGRA